MTYKVKEIFYTLQGEGTHAGRPAVFCRFSSCNLWTGRESDRERAICKFCDTDFVGTDGEGGGKFADCGRAGGGCGSEVAGERRRTTAWSSARVASRFCSWTPAAVEAFHERGLLRCRRDERDRSHRRPASTGSASAPRSARNSSSTRATNSSSSSRRAGSTRRQFEHLDFESFRVQPMDGPDVAANTELAVKYCLDHPQWQLSLQTHKYLGIP